MKRSLVILPGLVSDDTTFAASGAWADGSNVRFRRGLPQTIGGWELAFATQLAGVCRAALPWTTDVFSDFLALGTHSNLFVGYGGEIHDITPDGFVAGEVNGTGGVGYGAGDYGEGGYGGTSIEAFFPLTWSFANWGEQLIACPRGRTLYLWENDTSAPAAPLTNAPEAVTAVLVAPNRQVHAFGCTQVDGTFNPLCIRGSDIRDNTSWTPSPSNNAFEVILEGGGRIVAALPIGDYQVVWTTMGLYLGQDTGAPNQPYSYRPVAGAIGIIGAKAAVVVGSTAFYLGADGQFYRYDLGGSVQPIPCPIRDDLADNIAASQGDKVQASYISEFNEVWWDYPDQRDGIENSRYVALNLLSDPERGWFKGQMSRSCRVFAQPHPIGVTPDGWVYLHEKGNSDNGAPMQAWIVSADQYVSEEQSMLLRGVWPDIKSQQGAVSLSITTRFLPQGDETTTGPIVMSPSQDKVDFRATGRLIRLRLESNSSPSFWRLGKPIIDGVAAGTR